jgi:hypothetical protein
MAVVAAVAKKKLVRVEIRTDADWLTDATAEAQRWGLSLSAYIRLAVNEKKERDRSGPQRRQPGKPNQEE